MTITEESRYLLHQKLEALLGPQEALVLMEHLPPVGWADVACKEDLGHLEVVTRLELGNVEAHLRAELKASESRIRAELASSESRIRADMASMQRWTLSAIVGATSILAALSVVFR